MTTRGSIASSWDESLEREGLPRMSEAELVAGKGWLASESAHPCACGVVIVASPEAAFEVVSAHVAGARHQAWRAWRETV